MNFKDIVESSSYRQAWFDFRRKANMEWVKEQQKEDDDYTDQG